MLEVEEIFKYFFFLDTHLEMHTRILLNVFNVTIKKYLEILLCLKLIMRFATRKKLLSLLWTYLLFCSLYTRWNTLNRFSFLLASFSMSYNRLCATSLDVVIFLWSLLINERNFHLQFITLIILFLSFYKYRRIFIVFAFITL